MRFEGVIFDFDGTLVDSEPLHREAWFEVLGRFGLQFDEHWFEQWIGLSDQSLSESVIKQYGIKIKVEQLQDLKRNTYHAIASEQSMLFQGVEEGIKLLKEKYRLGIATNSSYDDVAAVFRKVKIKPYFHTIVTSNDVQFLKPAPDCYLLAAHRIGLAVNKGIAVEDSPTGVTAARKAGLFTIAVPNSFSSEKLQHANLVLDSTEKAIEWISQQ